MDEGQALLNEADAIMKGVAALEIPKEETSQVTELRFAPDDKAAHTGPVCSVEEAVRRHVQLPGAS